VLYGKAAVNRLGGGEISGKSREERLIIPQVFHESGSWLELTLTS